MTAHSLADVMPAVAAAVGVPLRPTSFELPRARAAVVLLVDGLGDHLLRRRGGHAPFLSQLRSRAVNGIPGALSAGFPSTTATSMGTFGTGLPPGAHGLVGLEILDPDRDVVFSELAWDPEVDPRRWQPAATVFEELAAAGRDAVRIGPGYFDGSGLTEATLRGGRFVAADTLGRRVEAALEAVRAGMGVVYVYWGEVDKTGHTHGCQSWQWAEEVALVDAAVRSLAERLGPDVLLVVTADHGMVDIPFENRLDLAAEPDLSAGIRHVGGEARALHLYCVPGAAPDVVAAWRERLGSRMDVVTRDEAVRSGWFGPVDARVLPRIGDVVAAAVGEVAVEDSRVARPELLRMVGLHGARTAQECDVPLLVTMPGSL
jgi:hypothetical protein